MNNDHAAIEAAEAIVRDAAEDVEQTIDNVELPLRLASEQLQRAGQDAQDALSRLYEAAQAYEPLQAAATRQVAALGLSVERWPDEDATLSETGIDADGLLVLRGTVYAAHTPADLLLRTLIYVLNENTALPAGARIELRMQRFVWGGE